MINKFKVGDIVKSKINDVVDHGYKVLTVRYKKLEVISNDGGTNNCIYVCNKSTFEPSQDKDITPQIDNLKYYKG